MNEFRFSGVVAEIEFKKTKKDRDFCKLLIRNDEGKWETDLSGTYWEKLPGNVEPGVAVNVVGHFTSSSGQDGRVWTNINIDMIDATGPTPDENERMPY